MRGPVHTPFPFVSAAGTSTGRYLLRRKYAIRFAKCSAVDHLNFEYEVHKCSSEERREIDLIEWRKLLGSFSNAKTLRIDDGLVEELSRFCNRMMESSR
jgi:hypothetical protein